MIAKKTLRRFRIKKRIRKRVAGSPERPRLSVFKSNTAMYVQIIDDIAGKTLAAASTRDFNDKKNTNLATAAELGKRIAEKALENGINTVVFDRNGYLYHGKVKALADAVRDNGLKI